MRGQEKIIALRRSGKCPAFVFINDYPCPTDWFETDMHATVCTDGDSVDLLDLRFLVGMRALISSTDESRAKALFEAAKRSGACVVASCHLQDGVPNWAQNGWAEVWKKEVANGAA